MTKMDSTEKNLADRFIQLSRSTVVFSTFIVKCWKFLFFNANNLILAGKFDIWHRSNIEVKKKQKLRFIHIDSMAYCERIYYYSSCRFSFNSLYQGYTRLIWKKVLKPTLIHGMRSIPKWLQILPFWFLSNELIYM